MLTWDERLAPPALAGCVTRHPAPLRAAGDGAGDVGEVEAETVIAVATRAGQVDDGVDDADVAEGLREVAQEGASRGVDFLREEAQVIGARQQAVQQRLRA